MDMACEFKQAHMKKKTNTFQGASKPGQQKK